MTLDRSTIRDHYQQAAPVYEALATVEDYPTIGLNDFVGWYVKRDHDDVDVIEAGYPTRGRVAQLDRDFDELCNRVERTLYAVTTYKAPDAFRRWEPCRYDADEERIVWHTEPPTPGYADLRAVPAWGDIDLADDIKSRRTELASDTRAVVEETLAAYADEFATLYGTQDAVYALDSVGGAYIFGAPEATLPIAEEFDADSDALARIFDAFLDRSNEWLREAEHRVNERVNGAADVIHPDWVNNKNRQYKPPLSIHADHDAVVYPLDPAAPTYEWLPLDEVTSGEIERATAWAETFTRVEHTSCVSSLVATLWPDLYDEHEDWTATLAAWVEAERERDREHRRQREQALRRRQERLEDSDYSLTGQPLTPVKRDVYDAVDAVDITEIARLHASDAYDTDPAQPRPQFDPSWRHSESGQSCFVDPEANIFGDSKVNAGGGPAKLMALAEGIIDDARTALDGAAYWEAADALREAGYDIPVWVPDAESAEEDETPDDQMPFWAVRKAAVVLGVCSPDEFVERDGADGVYEGFPDYETYNAALEAISEAGLTHGREPVSPSSGTAPPAVVAEESDSPEPGEQLRDVHLRERNRLLEERVDRLTATIDAQAAELRRLRAENASLRSELKSTRSDAADEDQLEPASDYQETDESGFSQPEAGTTDSLVTRFHRLISPRK